MSLANFAQKKRGLVSEAGLERLAQRVGLDCLPEDTVGPDGRKRRTLIIAGSAIQIDIVLDNNIVESIMLAFPESSASVTKHVDRASEILLKDLQLLPCQSPLTKTLDKFAINLERLASLDKLSIIPGLDCHEALAGIYVSLERLYKWDMSRLREAPEMKEKPDFILSVAAMCTRHGFPVMHSRDRVGLALQYWKERHLISPIGDKLSSYSENREKIWSLLIGCSSTGGLGHLPARVSEDWISKDIVKADLDPLNPVASGKPNLDWQEPENVVLPVSEENKDAGVEVLQPDLSTARVPEVMFTVTFDPPIILPQHDWMRLHAYANVSAPQIFGYPPPTFDSLFYPFPPNSAQNPSELRTISRQRVVRVYDENRDASSRSHWNTLYIYKPIYSQMVKELPFSHPRQLIEMLPVLRQYAFVSTLLENSFGSDTKEARPPPSGTSTDPPPKSSTTARDDLSGFMDDGATTTVTESQLTPSKEDLNMDITLWVHPTPHLQVVFPFRNSTANITINIVEDGVVQVTDENVLPRDGSTTGKSEGKLTAADLGRVLEHMEDLCKWAEWIRTRLGRE